MKTQTIKPELKNAIPFAETFSRLLYPFAEIVIHDLEEDRIEAIFNPISKREVGDTSYLDQWDFTTDPTETIIGPYEKTNSDGSHFKSISLILRDDQENAVGFMCVNMDVSVFETYRKTLDLFLSNSDPKLTRNN